MDKVLGNKWIQLSLIGVLLFIVIRLLLGLITRPLHLGGGLLSLLAALLSGLLAYWLMRRRLG